MTHSLTVTASALTCRAWHCIALQAHACLTDKTRRRAFDAERTTALCGACHATTKHRASTDKKSTPSSAPSARQQQREHSYVAKPPAGVSRRRPAQTQALREVQNRLRDECRIIDDCLRANGDILRRRQSFPLFDPSDRQRFPNYPHARPSPFAGCRPSFKEELGVDQDQGWTCRGATAGGSYCESPVYQVRTAPECAARTRCHW